VPGFGDDEINRILDYLYPVLANEIQQPIKHSCKTANYRYFTVTDLARFRGMSGLCPLSKAM